ncbi:hypothetical protein I204_02087 [Kwoniella mangroviensis CBS 8886]|nr:uncharacterized protein I203_08532 [Kwoniella mangroviensis CBS 8507]OCF62395.1 hypothetical protein I203_08532 [Kwoniella mangroviensis CBS 8507]OCF76392.1 hypothetical protein I204_02087 [Kwoniella mangroviensis CBS 8886]
MLVDMANPSSSRISITDLPREVIRLIALKIYDPLELTQQDRLTWGIFSTVDMHQERQDDLASLISLGMVCRKIRREVRRILFTCVRVSGVHWAEEIIGNRDGWARYVKSIIIDLTMFDSDPDASTRTRLSPIEADPFTAQTTDISSSNVSTENIIIKPRSCWAESSLLTSLLNSLPSLNHLSFFADASDDSTLALLFASLIPHPSLHAIPPTFLSTSPSTLSTISGSYGPSQHSRNPSVYIPFTHRLKSFGWRQRAAPPSNFRQFSQSSTFVSTLHLIRHSHNLSFLVLDADLDELNLVDILTPLKELQLRRSPIGEKSQLISLMICGPIRDWDQEGVGNGFLKSMVNTFDGIKELFIDRPLKKSMEVRETSFEDFVSTSLLSPLSMLPYLRLLQVGSYTFTNPLQSSIVKHISRNISSLLVVGLLGEEGETVWWGIWRRASVRGMKASQEGEYDEYTDTLIKFLGDGELRILEDEYEEWLKISRPPTPPQSAQSVAGLELDLESESKDEDVRMTPRNTLSPIGLDVQRLHALGLSLDGSVSSPAMQHDEERGRKRTMNEGGGMMEGEGRRVMSLDRLLG